MGHYSATVQEKQVTSGNKSGNILDILVLTGQNWKQKFAAFLKVVSDYHHHQQIIKKR